MAISALSADLLIGIAQSRVARASVASGAATGTTKAVKAPWENTASLTPASTLVSNALSGKAMFDASTKKFSTPGLSADARKLFALHAGINTLSALAGRYDAEGVTDGEKQRLQRAFETGLKQLDAFLDGAKFAGLDVVRGALMTSAISKAVVASTPKEYTTGIVARGDPSLATDAFTGNLAFTIDAKNAEGHDVQVNIDLADMGATPRSLNSVMAFLNQKLTGAGLTSAFAIEKGAKAANGQEQYALKFKMAGDESFSFSAAATSPALYVVGGENRLVKIQDSESGAAPPALPGADGWVQGRVFDNPLQKGDVRATATGPDGAVYVLATIAPEDGQPIKGTQDVALSKYDTAGHLLYTRKLGAAEEGQGFALAVSADGQIAVSGAVVGALSGADLPAGDAAESDSFVSLYDAEGLELWTARDGASGNDEATALAFGVDGTLYVGGRTQATMDGSTNAGGWDSYLRAYDPAGILRSTTQFGSLGDDAAQALAVEDIGGGIQRVTLASSENGKLVLRQFSDDGVTVAAGTTRDLGSLVGGKITGLAVDGADIYVAGNVGAPGLSAGTVTNAYSGGQDGFVAKLASDLSASVDDRISYIGGTGEDSVAGIAVSGGQVWLAGDSKVAFNGDVAHGERDGFVARLDATGALDWTQRFSEKDGDFAVKGFAFDAVGASTLDRFGLPSGPLDLSDSALLTAHTALRAGDSFSIAINGRSAQTITIKADDTLKTLADRIERVLQSDGDAKITVGDGGDALKISASVGDKITLSAGPAAKNALAALGLSDGVVRATPTSAIAKKKATPAYGLGISSSISLDSKLDRKLASDAFGTALSTIQKAYRTLTNPVSTTATGKAPAYLTAQIANYQAALSRLQGS